MDNVTVPRMAKWPFVLGDLLLLGFAGLVVYLSVWPLNPWMVLGSGLAVLTGAWLCVTPFLLEYRAEVERAQTDAVTSSLTLLHNLEKVDGHISLATAQWQNAQEMAERTTQTAKGIAERMAAEAKAFSEFLQKANETEKAHLRLEAEKLRRAEGEWLQITTALLDHVFALYQAAVRSRQPGLIEQLGNFQRACRDVVRRVGLVPFMPEEDAPFDPKVHQPANGDGALPAQARVRQTLAVGYTYQGQFLRRALVEVQGDNSPELSPSNKVTELETPRVEPEQVNQTEVPGEPSQTSTSHAGPQNRSGEQPVF